MTAPATAPASGRQTLPPEARPPGQVPPAPAARASKRGVFAHAREDLPASLVVFLVALPLCLGIAVASGAPPLAGIVAGVVGGIVVGIASGSQLLVSGPAAGLTAIVLAGIQQAGSYQRFLPAVVVGGVVQLALGAARGGVIGYYFPSAVIKGMLAAIGLTLILKQIPHAVGYDADYEGRLRLRGARRADDVLGDRRSPPTRATRRDPHRVARLAILLVWPRRRCAGSSSCRRRSRWWSSAWA
jgi:hypothetical protein